MLHIIAQNLQSTACKQKLRYVETVKTFSNIKARNFGASFTIRGRYMY